MLQIAAALVVVLGIAHSVLGERYILIRLFRRDSLPKLFGSTDFTRNTLRFVWHLVTVLGFGFAAILFQLAGGASASSLVSTIGWSLLASGLLPLLFTRGRHLSWLLLFAAGGLCQYWVGL